MRSFYGACWKEMARQPGVLWFAVEADENGKITCAPCASDPQQVDKTLYNPDADACVSGWRGAGPLAPA